MATTNGNGAVQNGITATLDRIGDIAVARPCFLTWRNAWRNARRRYPNVNALKPPRRS